MDEKQMPDAGDGQFRLHKHWIVLVGLGVIVGSVVLVSSSLDKLDQARGARQSEIEYLTSRISEAEERIDVLEKSNSFAEAALAKEAADERDRAQRSADLERLRANERLIESNQQLLCDATGDC